MFPLLWAKQWKIKLKENRKFPHRGHSNLGFTSELGAQELHSLCQHQYQNNRELVTSFSAGFTVNSDFSLSFISRTTSSRFIMKVNYHVVTSYVE